MDILMVAAQQDFRDEEFTEPRHVLKAAGHRVVICSKEAGACTSVKGSTLIASVALATCGSIVSTALSSWAGRAHARSSTTWAAHRIAVEMSRASKVLGATCIAPVILARAGVLVGRRATRACRR